MDNEFTNSKPIVHELSKMQLKNRLYKNLQTQPKDRYDHFEKKLLQATSTSSLPQVKLIPKVATKPRLEPLQSPHQSSLGVTIEHGRILLNQSILGKQKQSVDDILVQDQQSKKPQRQLAPLNTRLLSDHGISALENESIHNPNTTINDSLIGTLLPPQKETKKDNKKAIRKQKKKTVQTYLSPMDFIYLIRTDPEMADEFCYLNKRNHPYDYQIVEFDDRNPKEYMTISSRGITYFLNEEATFLTIEEWQREAQLYNDLQKIDFFKNYKLWKNFFLWKRLMRKNILIKNQNLMIQNLFSVDKQLRMTMLEVRKLCQQMAQDIRFLDTSTTVPQSHEAFKALQDKHLMSVMDAKFDNYEQQIRDLVVQCCHKSLISFKEIHRIPLREDEENEDRAPLLVGDESGKEMPFTTEATIRTHYKRLRKFVKYIDYLIIDAKMLMMVNSVEQIVRQVRDFNETYKENMGVKKKGYYKGGSAQCWMIVEAMGKGEDILFNPQRDHFIRMFEQIVQNNVLRITTRHKELINMPEFSAYVQDDGQLIEKVDVKQMIQQSENYQLLCGQMRRELEQAFDYVEHYAGKIKPFMKWYQENTSIDIVQAFTDKEVEDYRNAITRYKEQDQMFQEIEPTAEIGILLFDNQKLKNKIRHSAMGCITELQKFIPEYIYKKAVSFTQRTNQLYSTISIAPITVEQFVVYMEAVNVINGQFEELSNVAQEVTAIAMLMDELKIKLNDRYKQKYAECNNSLSNLRKKVDDAMASYDQNLNKFRKEMERMIPQVENTVKDLAERLTEQPLASLAADLNDMVKFVNQIRKSVDDLKVQAKKLNDYQIALSMEYTPFEKLEIFNNEFSVIEKLWNGRNEWIKNHHVWLKQHFMAINLEEMSVLMEKLQKSANLCAKELDKNEVAKTFKQDIESFRGVYQVLQALKDPALAEKQWGQIRTLIAESSDLLKQQVQDAFTNITDTKYTVEYIQQIGLDALKDKLSEIALRAAKEIELVKMLEQVESVWKVTSLTVVSYRDSKDVFILGNNEDLISKIDDTLLTVNNILASRFVEGIRADVEKQQALLRYFQELLDEWMLHQRNWLYLEPILNSPYSAKNLAKEAKIFSQADSQWKKIMRQARDSGIAKRWADDYSNRVVINTLRQNNNNFDLIQKALDEFLEKKRDVFQRFYFLSNDELLEILSNAKNIQAIQPYLRKCFENIVKLQFDPQENVIGMISSEGETAILRGYSARGEVEEWLKSLEDKMKSSLAIVMRQSMIKYHLEDTLRRNWVFEFPLQIIITIDSILWTKITEENYLAADAEGDLDDWYDSNVAMLDELTQLIRGNLTDLQRRTLVALVTQDVHFRDIIDNMRNESVEGVMDFKWQQQLRFYQDEESVHAKQVNAKLQYGYEYLGSTTRLVITPLTDRCWMTITGALGIKLGAAPQGPAGTGKTESCKDLAKALGRYCIVFNCSDQITAKMMEKLFAGLAYCGAWVCLDEFNRIYIEVLSVIAQQVQTIREALLDYRQNFYFFGKNVQLNPDLGIFITMNPGYAGRTELPDNLKVLFRPVAMMVPDYRLIAEIMLFAEGFSNAKDLSRKMVKLYQLSSEQLSQQDHYDFGMRAVKSVLVMAGSLKRAEPNVNEDIVLIRAMRESNLPKFLSHDIPLFNAIVGDLFPGMQIPIVENKELDKAIKEQIEEKHFQPAQGFIEKVIQFHETLKVRFGVMLVGVTLGGKSAVQNILRESYCQLGSVYKNVKKIIDHPVYQNVEHQILNPKAISMEELYGQFDLMTQQWTDGLASNIMRGYASSDSPDKKWVLFDGPVDALWIENMNTVLDDSMTLCLSNGERIKLKTQMRMIFEVLDLAVASPATVSRCGMVYLDDKVLGYEPIMITEAHTLADLLPLDLIESLIVQIRIAFNKAVGPILKQCKQLIQVSQTQMAISSIRILRMLLQHYNSLLGGQLKDELSKKHLEKLYVWVFAWSVGATFISDDYPKFERLLGDLYSVDLLPRGSVFHCLVRLTRHEGMIDVGYVSWGDMIPQFEYTKGMSYFDMVVQTKETVAHGWLIEQAVNCNIPIFITGASGTGKSIMINSQIEKLAQDGLVALNQMTFSAKTAANSTQMSIEQKLQTQRKKGRTILMPPPGKKFVIFVDDVNMPALEQYGAQPPIELLRQFIDYKGVYDRKGFFWKDIDNTILICACAPPGGGRSQITVRFTRHFTLFSVPNSSDETLSWIFSTILRSFLRGNHFKAEVCDLAENNSIVNATLQMYGEIQKALLPTPEKSHYVFNLRDVSKIFQGILQAKPLLYQKAEAMVRLWAHETCRVLMDRLINSADQDWFKENLTRNLFLFFKIEYKVAELFESSPPLMFVDFQKRGVELQDRSYEEVRDLVSLSKIIGEYMMEQNMNLVLFKDAIEHLARLARVLRQQRGHYMLVGVGGSGKKSITNLGSLLAGCKVDTIEQKKVYGKKEFKEDLFRMMCKVAIDNQLIAFSFADTQILQESFLEDVNNLLNAGEVPNMLNKDDLEYINQNLGQEAREKQINDIYPYFVSKVRANMHVVLGMSPIGGQLRVRLRMFPALVNCCTIEWLQKWPQEALLSVAEMFLGGMEFEGLTKDMRERLYQMCVYVHQSVEKKCVDFYNALKRSVYVTPKSYLDLIEAYKSLLQMKKEELQSNKLKLRSGLEKLSEANTIISDLKVKLTQLQPILKQKTIDQDILLAKLQEDSREANKVKQSVSEEERVVNEQAQQIKETKADAEKILNEALPVLQAATEALNTLNRNDISEIKSNNNPQPIVRFTLECVAVLFEEKQDWDSIKKLLADPNFLSKMKGLDVGKIKPQTQTKIKQKIAGNAGFIPAEVAKVSVAAKSICEWVRAVSEFTDVNNDVEKKKVLVEGMNQSFEKMNAKLAIKQAELAAVVRKVTELENQFNQNKQEKDRLDADIQTTEQRLVRAEELTVGLAEEQQRWHDKVERLTIEIQLLLGNVFIGGSTVAYLGSFTGVFRNQLVQQWLTKAAELELPISEKYDFEEVLGDALEIQNWASNGLPNDSVSKANGIIQKFSASYPLFIDPQLQASVWVKNMYREHNLKVFKITQDQLVKHMEHAIQSGIPVLLEDVQEQLENFLEPLLLKQFTVINRRKMIKLSDRDIEFDPNFKLFLTTKLSNPQFLPEIFIRVCVINFTVTEQGLEEQLLGDVVLIEKPEMEEEKRDLVKRISLGNLNLRKNEEKILNLLANSKGMILDNVDLIENLKISKRDATIVKESLVDQEKKSAEINEARLQYLPVATRGSILYFVIADFALIDPMYQFSLNYFKRLYQSVIRNAEQSDDIQSRIRILIEGITEVIYLNVCRGLFNQHKRIFSFLMTSKILLNSKMITYAEWNQFVRGASLSIQPPAMPATVKLTPKLWNEMYQLTTVHPNFVPVYNNLVSNFKEVETFLQSESPWTHPLLIEQLSPFQKLMIIKVLREEESLYAMTYYVDAILGKKFTSNNVSAIEDIYNDTDHKTPFIFILSQGADPLASLMRLAQQKKITSDKLRVISLGQGQGIIAEKAIETGVKSGDWVILQNCHLGKSFMPALEKRLEWFDEPDLQAQFNTGFRLFLTSMPCDYFPVSVLQNGVKLTTEPPKGLKSNMFKSFTDLTSEQVETCEKQGPWKKLLYSLAFFHAIVQERRKFGPLGWNIRYEFNDSDFETSHTLLKNFLDLPQDIPWDAIVYVIGEITYGGRVTDDWDRRCLLTVLSKYINEDALNDNYSFSESGIYKQPQETNIDGYRGIIDRFPDFEKPEVFGMNENANITFKLTESKMALSTILSIQPRDTGGSSDDSEQQTAKTPDQQVLELCDILASKLPFQIKEAEKQVKGKKTALKEEGQAEVIDIDSLKVCLTQEVQRFNRLLSVIQNSLKQLQAAIRGEVVMSAELDKMYSSLLNNQVPQIWANKAYPSLKPLASFYEDMIKRVTFFRDWFNLEYGYPKGYWLSAFFFPQGFLTSILQTYARKNQIAIDILGFSYKFFNYTDPDMITNGPENGAYIYGLYIEGCRFDFNKLILEDQQPGQTVVQAPVIHMIPTQDYKPNPSEYSMPVYKTSLRAGVLSTTGHSTNFIRAIECPTRKNPDYWILNGAAFTTQLND